MQNPYDDEKAFAKYLNIRKRENNYNDNVEIPIFKSLLPDLRGKEVLDLGCGYGEMSKWYVEQGALAVVGVDISKKMIARARAFNSHPAIDYEARGMEAYDFPTEKYDLVTSSLAFQYVGDFERLIAGVSRSLRPGGQLVFSQEHPVFTCIEEDDFWVRDEAGEKASLKHFHYSDEGPKKTGWLGVDMHIYHRRLETVVTTLLKHNLQIEALKESEVSPEVIEKYPSLADTREAANFIFFRCKKATLS
jgi:SAM-dependent methyltransferase